MVYLPMSLDSFISIYFLNSTFLNRDAAIFILSSYDLYSIQETYDTYIYKRVFLFILNIYVKRMLLM